MYAIREGIEVAGGVLSRDNGGGEWYAGDGRWTPCGDRAETYDDLADAEAAKEDCGRRIARIVDLGDDA